jgi:hypothetical protein
MLEDGRDLVSGLYEDDPRFVDPQATPPDLHLQSTAGSRRNGTSAWMVDRHCSIAIDKAAPSDAFDREPSPHGNRRNLGAYGNTSEASKTCGAERATRMDDEEPLSRR